MRDLRLEAVFPGLRGCEYYETSPQDPSYNCIAWAAGFNDRWWWPSRRPSYYWPGDPDDQSMGAFIAVFASLGYAICDSDTPEAGFEKVAIYANESGPTHIARQLPTGEWTSKCGGLEDIAHTLSALEGDCYGTVAVIMRRKAAG